jgi:hypothetical protein
VHRLWRSGICAHGRLKHRCEQCRLIARPTAAAADDDVKWAARWAIELAIRDLARSWGFFGPGSEGIFRACSNVQLKEEEDAAMKIGPWAAKKRKAIWQASCS